MTPEEKAAEAARREESRKEWKEATDRALAGEPNNFPPEILENERRAREQYDDKGLPRPSLTERIKDYFKRVESGETEPMGPTNMGELFGPGTIARMKERANPQPPRPEGLQRVATGIADWATGNKWDFDQRGGGLGDPIHGPSPRRGPGEYTNSWPQMTPPAPGTLEEFLGHDHGPDRFPERDPQYHYTDPRFHTSPPLRGPMSPTPLDKTLERRVWERDQMPQRTPDNQGRLYPDKNDPGFIDPRIQGDGRMTMQYIPELDNPNWTPEKPMPRSLGRGGEGVQYRL